MTLTAGSAAAMICRANRPAPVSPRRGVAGPTTMEC